MLHLPIYTCCRPQPNQAHHTHLLVLDVVCLVHDDHPECEVFAIVPQLPEEVVGCNDSLQTDYRSLGTNA